MRSDSSALRVAIVTNLFPSADDPTRGIFNRNRFAALARHCQVRVVAPRRWWSSLRRPRGLLRAPSDNCWGMPTCYPAYFPLPGRPPSHVTAMRAAVRPLLARMRTAFPFDALLTAMAYPDGAATALLADDFEAPLVTMVLGSDLNVLAARPALRPRVRRGLLRAQRVVAVSRDLRERALELGVPDERITVQHNGVDGERFRPRDRSEARGVLGLEAGRRLLLYAGNLEPVKGVDLLVEAMGRLGNGAGDAQLVILGGGTQEAALRRRVRELALDDCVRFVGRRPHEEIPTWMSACDLFCLPSRREGCPNVVLEALAAGTPVVAAGVGGVLELLSEANGVVVTPEDPTALADGIRIALARRWDPAAQRASVPFLSWDRFGRALADTLQAAVDEWAGRRSGSLACSS